MVNFGTARRAGTCAVNFGKNFGTAPRVRRAGVHGKLWHRAEEYCVWMHTLNLALHVCTHIVMVHVVCAVLQNTEEFGWCMHTV
jgi:hypothetical protein